MWLAQDEYYTVTFGGGVATLPLTPGQGSGQRNPQTGNKQSPPYSSDSTFLSLFLRPRSTISTWSLTLLTFCQDLGQSCLLIQGQPAAMLTIASLLDRSPFVLLAHDPLVWWFHWDFLTLDSCATASPCHSTPRRVSGSHSIYILLCPSDLCHIGWPGSLNRLFSLLSFILCILKGNYSHQQYEDMVSLANNRGVQKGRVYSASFNADCQ